MDEQFICSDFAKGICTWAPFGCEVRKPRGSDSTWYEYYIKGTPVHCTRGNSYAKVPLVAYAENMVIVKGKPYA